MSRLFVICTVVSALVLFTAPDVGAYDCDDNTAAAGLPWNTRNVKVYVHYAPSFFGPSQGLLYSLGFSESDTENMVQRALNIINEESGGKVKLQFAGVTSSSSDINNAIVLRSANIGSEVDCSNAASGSQNALAVASTVASGGFRRRARIAFFKRHGNPCNPIAWTNDETNNTINPDVVSTLLHELGHAFFDVGHPNEPAFGCTIGSTDWSIMSSNAFGIGLVRSRVLKDWDIETFQVHHGLRGPYASLQRSYRLSTAWQALTPATNSVGWKFHYRPGSIGPNIPMRNVGSLINVSSTTPQPGGGGLVHSGRYDVGNFSNQLLNANNTLMRPVATASRPGTLEVLVAYVRRHNGTYVPNSDVGEVCYRKSFDQGITFGSETCKTSWLVHRNGLTAAYDSVSNMFIVTYIGDADLIQVSLIRGDGSTLSELTSSGPSFDYRTAWHAPAIACAPSGICRMVWEGRYNFGCRTTVDVSVNTSTAQMTFVNTSTALPCFSLFDTPGLAYNYAGGYYEMLFTSKHDAVYSYVSYPGSHTWYGDGDVWNSTNSFVLSAVLGFRSWGPTLPERLQAWMVRYL